MDPSSSPPVLYLGDDDDDEDDRNNEQHSFFGTHQLIPRISSSIEINSAHKKRRLPEHDFRISPPPMDHRSKRQRHDHYQQRFLPNTTTTDVELDSELILLDPNDYIIEEPDTQPFRSFDWTIQSEPPPSPVLPPRIPSNHVTTVSRTLPTNGHNTAKRPMDKGDVIIRMNSNERFVQQPPIKSTTMPVPRPSLALLSVSSSKPTSPYMRVTSQRGRPAKSSRAPTIQSTSSSLTAPSQPVLARKQQVPTRPPPLTSSSTTIPSSSMNNISVETRRQMFNGTGLFSAFHDSKYYHCNICKFKSVTSSTLLQHLFTHMFFCEHCSYYTYSSFNLSQHMFEKHHINPTEETPKSTNPNSFDLLYVTRCTDGTFALCMDSSMKSTTTTNKNANNNQQLIISSGMPTDQQVNKVAKQKSSQIKDTLPEMTGHTPPVIEKRERTTRSSTRTKREQKSNKTYALMKHRPFYSTKKSPSLHALTLEYNICREHIIRHISHTEHIEQPRHFPHTFPRTRLIDEVANCLKTIVNQIVDNEQISNQSYVFQPMPNDILQRLFPLDNLNMLTNVLKLRNKFDRELEAKQLFDNGRSLRQSNEHVFILSSPDSNQTEQAILSSLHSSMTNGDSIFTQTKIQKLASTFDNTHRYLKSNSNQQTSTNNPAKSKPITPRPVICKPSRSLSHTSPDRNNNSVSSVQSPSSSPTVIILD